MEDKIDMISFFVLSFYGPILTAILILFVFLLFYVFKCRSALQNDSFTGKHIVITGGSSGIGKQVAIQAAMRGAHVTIIARDAIKLQSAKEEITLACLSPEQRIVTMSCDVSADAEAVARAVSEAEELSGPVFMLVTCAGAAVCGRLEDTSVQDFRYMMDLNYYGTVFPVRAVVGGMKQRRQGHIVLVSSQAGLIGVFGFTAYSASKFALRGFAEALDMEARAYGVRVTVSLPPDTDTPGLHNENKSKPEETMLISQSSGLFSPEIVAKRLLNDAVGGKFFSTVGFEGWMLTMVCAGMAPVTSFLDLISQVILMGLLRLISVCYLLSFQNIVRKLMKKKDQAKRSE